MTSTRNLLAGEAVAGVRHQVALSVVGSERLTDSGSSLPYSIVRATPFFEFVKAIADWSTDGNTVYLPQVLIQPMAADGVASAVCRAAMARQ